MGWRSWAVVEYRGELRLRSVLFDTIWQPQQELVAVCNRAWQRIRLPLMRRRRMAHEIPNDRCGCGIYASNDLEAAADYLYVYEDVRQPNLRYRAFGRVSMWGSVVEGENGWRATRAYPGHILLPATDRRGRDIGVTAIAAGLGAYGVPIAIVADDDETAVGRAIGRVKRGVRRRRRGATQTG